jgi:hypothetical protein
MASRITIGVDTHLDVHVAAALADRIEQQQIDDLRAVFQEHLDLDRFIEAVASRGRSQAHDSRSHLILHVELWLLSMRNDSVRERFAAIQRRGIEAIAELVVGADIDLSPEEIAGVVTAVSDGLLMQRYLDPDQVRPSMLTDVLRQLATWTGLIPPKDAL